MNIRRTGVVAALATVLLAGPLAGVALAHVGVSATGATQGGYATITFTVPTERDVPTTAVEVALPQDTPIASVRVEPKPGWTVSLTRSAPAVPMTDDDGPVDEVVSRIVWTATGDGIAPDQFDRFTVSAGPLPQADTVVFKVLQTYADGQVVSWIEQTVDGAAEPDHPAPVLALAAATGADHHADGAGSAPGTDVESSTHDSTNGLAIAALVVALVALLGVGYLLATRRRVAGGPPATPDAPTGEPVGAGAGAPH